LCCCPLYYYDYHSYSHYYHCHFFRNLHSHYCLMFVIHTKDTQQTLLPKLVSPCVIKFSQSSNRSVSLFFFFSYFSTSFFFFFVFLSETPNIRIATCQQASRPIVAPSNAYQGSTAHTRLGPCLHQAFQCQQYPSILMRTGQRPSLSLNIGHTEDGTLSAFSLPSPNMTHEY